MANPTSQISVIGNLVASRAAAQMGWKESAICLWSLGSFDTTSKMLFFLSLFLFMSLACRPSLFKKSMRKFNVAWWAYSFPLTFLALAAAEYEQEVKGHVAAALMLVLSVLSVLIFLGLMLLTAANAERLLGETDPMVSFSNNLKPS
ncbi:C4-dicarboxylate transporter/malic acid transport protein [Corchorus olitorius]|uniref:C4-dicarboxylate transporter/malic acid transport protein n=1 Tax=Corchorus olitorius TaxID=93759 RepID=A0A1R3H3G7_9ROSI|nr:C4-dicarboxylate transporter/malic acid transport protein [Corchorus olitorius]